MVDITVAREMANVSGGHHYVIISNDLMIILRVLSGLAMIYPYPQLGAIGLFIRNF